MWSNFPLLMNLALLEYGVESFGESRKGQFSRQNVTFGRQWEICCYQTLSPFSPPISQFSIWTNVCYLHKSSLKFRDTKYTCIYFLSFPPMKISNGQILTQICFKFGSNFCGGGVFVEPVKVKVQLLQFKFSISATTREEACANWATPWCQTAGSMSATNQTPTQPSHALSISLQMAALSGPCKR